MSRYFLSAYLKLTSHRIDHDAFLISWLIGKQDMVQQTSRIIVMLLILSLGCLASGNVMSSEAAGPTFLAKKGKSGARHVSAHDHHQPGPPSHAPAHGYRHKHKYHYYPAKNVYYDLERKLYFYLQGDQWKTGVALPTSIRLDLGKSTSLELDTDVPYRMLTKD